MTAGPLETGIGIDAGNLMRVFEKFGYVADTAGIQVADLYPSFGRRFGTAMIGMRMSFFDFFRDSTPTPVGQFLTIRRQGRFADVVERVDPAGGLARFGAVQAGSNIDDIDLVSAAIRRIIPKAKGNVAR